MIVAAFEAKKDGGKAVKLEVMTGECRLDATNVATLRLSVYGKYRGATVLTPNRTEAEFATGLRTHGGEGESSVEHNAQCR